LGRLAGCFSDSLALDDRGGVLPLQALGHAMFHGRLRLGLGSTRALFGTRVFALLGLDLFDFALYLVLMLDSGV
jgi:hypothetical protein